MKTKYMNKQDVRWTMTETTPTKQLILVKLSPMS